MKTYDVAIVGSGLIGVSAAYELAKTGHSVALLDARGLSSGASGANTGALLFEGVTQGAVFDICAHSLARYETLAEELGRDIGFSTFEMVNYLQYEREFPIARKMVEEYAANGFCYELIDAPALHRLEPDLNMEGILGAVRFEQWKMDPLRVVYAYFARARQLGMDWYPYHKVTGFEHDGTRIIAAITSHGPIHAGQFVVAAGAWTRELMLTLGVDIPEYYIQGAALVLERGKVNLNTAVCHFDPVRPRLEQACGRLALTQGWGNFPPQEGCEFIILLDSNGNVITAQRNVVRPDILTAVPPDYVRDMAKNVLRHFPAIGKCKAIRSWICPVPFVPDGKPFLGFVAPYGNLLITSGYASVLIMTPVLGSLACSLLDGEGSPYDISAFAPLRFDEEEYRWTVLQSSAAAKK